MIYYVPADGEFFFSSLLILVEGNTTSRDKSSTKPVMFFFFFFFKIHIHATTTLFSFFAVNHFLLFFNILIYG